MSDTNTLITHSGWELNPTSSEHAMELAKWIAESGLVPKDFSGQPKKICVAAAMGAKLGLDVFSSMAGIAVINGRPSLWGDVLRGIILAHPKCENIEETYEGAGDDLTAVCIITRKGMTPYTATFSVEDAKTAGLWGRNVWANFSKDMLANRAFGRAARRRFADALSGISVAEEALDAEIIKDIPSYVVPETDEPADIKPAASRSTETPDASRTASEVAAEDEKEATPEAPATAPIHDMNQKDEAVEVSGDVTLEVLVQVAKELAAMTSNDTIKKMCVDFTDDEKKFKVMDVDPKHYRSLHDVMLDTLDALGA